MDLVTLARTKAGLVIDHTDDDAVRLPMLITAASTAVINYLKDRAVIVLADALASSPPDLTAVPANVATATIMLVGYLYRNPDGDPDKEFSHGNLPWPVTTLIYQLRDPAMA